MKRWWTLLVLAVVVVAPVLVRARIEAKSALESGLALQAQGEHEEAFSRYREAIRWWSPFHTAPDRARQILEAAAFDSTASVELRVRALESLREGLMSGRNLLNWRLGEERQAEVERINKELERILGSNAPLIRDGSVSRDRFWVQLLSHLFFWAWVGMVLATVWRGFSPDGAIRERGVIARGGITAMLFFALWLGVLVWA